MARAACITRGLGLVEPQPAFVNWVPLLVPSGAQRAEFQIVVDAQANWQWPVNGMPLSRHEQANRGALASNSLQSKGFAEWQQETCTELVARWGEVPSALFLRAVVSNCLWHRLILRAIGLFY